MSLERGLSVLLEERRRVLRYPTCPTHLAVFRDEGGRRFLLGFQGRSACSRKELETLIDSTSYLLLATELDKDVVQSYLATLATPNQLI